MAPSSVYNTHMDLIPGQVAIHYDGNEHVAVILSMEGDQCEALFFTSNPSWAEVCRRATVDELAMAGYVSTKRTYLAYVIRPCWNFSPIEAIYPQHWVENLRREFSVQRQKLRQVSA